MGLDLHLLPITPGSDRWLAFSSLQIERDYDVFDMIRALEPERVPAVLKGVSAHIAEDGRWGTEKADAYGEPLTYVTAGQLAELNVDAEKTHHRNMAALAYCLALPPETPIVLWWH